jgi:hypothetical protein
MAYTSPRSAIQEFLITAGGMTSHVTTTATKAPMASTVLTTVSLRWAITDP